MACSFWNFGRERWLADLRGAQLGVFFQCSILSSPLLEKEGPRYFLYLYSSLRCYQIYFDSCARTSTRVCHSVLTNCMCCSSWFRPRVMVGTSSCCLLACNVWTILNSSFFFLHNASWFWCPFWQNRFSAISFSTMGLSSCTLTLQRCAVISNEGEGPRRARGNYLNLISNCGYIIYGFISLHHSRDLIWSI